MKKILLTVLMLCIAVSVQADPLSVKETLNKFPLKQGVAYSILDSEFNYISTIELIKKWGVTLEVGYAGAAENTDHKLIGVISYPIVKLDKYLDVPILELVDLNVGFYGGIGNICAKDVFTNDGSNEKDYGLSLTLINIIF